MIKIGYLISYDYKYIFHSIKTLYDDVDKIFIAIDKDYLTWNGNKFLIPNAFFDEIKILDVKNKIEFYFDSFYVNELTTMECETRERNMLSKKMGKGWQIQLDTDEYIYDFKTVKKLLSRLWVLNLFPFLNISFSGEWVTLYKKVDDGFLYIENGERFNFLFNKPNFQKARGISGSINIFTGIKAIHQSWARDEAEILDKIVNWGHNIDFDTDEYFKKWKALDKSNYLNYVNFHPLKAEVWDKLYLIRQKNIEDFIKEYESVNPQKLRITTYGIIKIITKYYWTKIRKKLFNH